LTLDDILKSFDSYSRVARLYPAILAIGPLLWSAIVVAPDLFSSLGKGTASVLALSCILYFLSSVARSRGKLAEVKLTKIWGGWPSTIVLRHRDATFDVFTKERYHKALNRVCPDSLMPSVAEENSDPQRADAIYRSATKRLIEARRDAKYKLLHGENASYGFRRNMLGLKPVAITIAVLASVLTLAGWAIMQGLPSDHVALLQSVRTYPRYPLLLTADLGYLVIWAAFVNSTFVRQASDEYSIALFRTLE
jgi:hypothetical protein